MHHFIIDKAMAVIVEGLAEHFISQYWANRGKKVYAYENEYEYLEGKRGYDRRDSLGNFWEVKTDVKAWQTGNVFIELTAFEHSKATHYLYFVQGMALALAREHIASLIAEFRSTELSGGDANKAIGVLVPIPRFRQVAEQITLTRYA